MRRTGEFKGKYILVTGASSGIGFQIARDFIIEGAYVGAHYCNNEKGARGLLRYSAKRGQCKLFQADFAVSQEVVELWDDFISWSGGRIDVLVNNAGDAVRPVGLKELTEEVWDKTFQINVKAPFLLSREALSLMCKKRCGRIINISSIGVKFAGSPTTMHYSASKAALEAITRSLAKTAAPFNVLVNIVRAGVTDTPFHKKIGRRDLSRRIDLIPLKRLARPEEVSSAVLFLASEKSSFVTNTIIEVAGGE